MIKAKPGMFGLSVINGKTGRWIAAGQALTGDGSRFTHAFIVVDNNEIVEAMPDGARVYPLAERVNDPGGVVFCDPVDNLLLDYELDGVPAQVTDSYEEKIRREIVEHARSLVGTPYSFVDYMYLGLAHLGIKAKLLANRIDNSGHMICSQLVDEVYRCVGINLFNDGRLPQDVTPGDLDYYRIRNEFGVL